MKKKKKDHVRPGIDKELLEDRLKKIKISDFQELAFNLLEHFPFGHQYGSQQHSQK